MNATLLLFKKALVIALSWPILAMPTRKSDQIEAERILAPE
jgi:hypothetical protein